MFTTCGDFSISNTPMPGWTQCKSVDPGWLYIIQNNDLFKVGKTTNPRRRLREASTWLPNGKLVGMKPFWHFHQFERVLLCGLANCWHKGEWHRFPDHDWSVRLTSDFAAFDDHDRNRNTVDFTYWIGGSGLGEVIMEQNYRRSGRCHRPISDQTSYSFANEPSAAPQREAGFWRSYLSSSSSFRADSKRASMVLR